MISRIEITTKQTDSRGESLKNRLLEEGMEVNDMWVTDVYTIEKEFSENELQKIGQSLANPVLQKHKINEPLAPDYFNYALEIGFLPGVTDNIATTAKELIEDLLKTKFSGGEDVYSSQVYTFKGSLEKSRH